jgi:single-strand DNA-binding protein
MARRTTRTTTDQPGPIDVPVNDVSLRGRLAAAAEQRELPSGDLVVTFRLVVARPARAVRSASSARVDTLDCAVFGAAVRKRSLTWVAGDVIDVRGSLRRRFFRAAGGPASRYEVEVASATRVARALGRGRATMTG